MAKAKPASDDVFEAHPASSTVTVPRPPAVYELNGEYIAEGVTHGQREWCIRGQNHTISLVWMASGEVVSEDAVPDEHAVLVLAQTAFEIAWNGEAPVLVEGPAFVVVPSGPVTLTAKRGGFLMRVFSSRAQAVLDRVNNPDKYVTADPRVAPLPDERQAGPTALRVHALSEVPADPERFGRIFRTESLMINWFEEELGPRDVNQLTPHEHDDFEQATVTLDGEYVHHLRTPWTARLDEWRPDEHIQVTSPSITIIPPGILHTTRAVGEGSNQLMDVFAPLREDFLQNNWVLNQSDYEERTK